jgi:hypothetical protein
MGKILRGYRYKDKTPRKQESPFKELAFDKEGKLLLISHESAGFYYKLNFAFLFGWFVISYKNYKENDSFILSSKKVTQGYMGFISTLLLVSFLMSNRHLKKLYLHSNGKDITLVRHKFFSLWYSETKIDIKSFNGVRAIFGNKLRLYQLDYTAQGLVRKRNTYMIFRPQYVYDNDLWRLVRNGHYVNTPEFIENKDKFNF